jgi:ABC-type multidrug transport system permease subunit
LKTTFKIIKKNIKLLIRSKGSALIVIFGPLLVIFLVGIAFDNSSAYRVKIGAFSEKYSDMSDSIVKQLDNKQFSVTRYKTQEECIEAIKQGNVHTCMVFSPDFTFGKNSSNQIVFNIDYSKVNLVWMILDTLAGELKSTSSQVSMDLTNVLLHKLEETEKEITADKAVVVKLTDGTNKVKTEQSSLQKGLGNLNLEMDMSQLPVKILINKTHLIGELAGYTGMHSRTLIDSIKSDIGKLNISTADKDKMTTLLDQTRFKIENINNKITNQSLDLDALGKSFETNINTIKSRLDAAGAARQATVAKLDELQKLLDTNINNLMVLQSSFNKIVNNLENIQVSEAENIVSPIRTTIRPVTADKTHLNYIFPTLMVLVIMFVSLLLSSTLVVMEKSSRAFFRNFITPTKDIVFVMATYFTSMLLILIQLIIILAVAAFFFKSELIAALPTATVVLLAVGTLFVLIGMTVGYLFNSEETSTLAAISIGSIFLFLSNVILPIESMPQYVMKLASFNPFVVSENMLRKSIIFHYPLQMLFREVLLILGYAAVFFVIIMVTQKLMKRNFVTRYAKRFAPARHKKK